MKPILHLSVVALVAIAGVACAPREPPPVLTSAELTIRAPEGAWAQYERAVSLQHNGETQRAVAAYREAEARFGDQVWGKSLAIYGRARAFDDAGHCGEAAVAYEEYASLVQTMDAGAAAMARSYAPLCQPDKSRPVDPLTSDVATAVVARDYGRAIALSEAPQPPSAEPRPWLDYNRGVAFAELKQTRDAVDAFKAAEQGFEQEHNRWGRSIAIYGRARALDTGDRCPAAKQAYTEYAAIVGDRQAADMARAAARRCER